MALLNTTPGALNQGSPASQPGQKLNASPSYGKGTPNQLKQALSGGVPNLGGTGKAPGIVAGDKPGKPPITKSPPIQQPIKYPPIKYPPTQLPDPKQPPIKYPPVPSPGAGPASKLGTNLNKSKIGAEKRHGYDEMAALAAKHGWAKQNNLPYDYTRDYPSNMPGLANQQDYGTGNQNKNSGKGNIKAPSSGYGNSSKTPSTGYGNPSSQSSGSRGASSQSSGSRGASSMGQPTHPVYGGDYLQDMPMQYSSDPSNWKSGAGTPGVGLPKVILPSDTQRSINQYASDQFGSADANYLANQMAGQGASADAGTMAMIAPKMGAAASDVSSFQKQKPLHDFYTNQMYQLGEDKLMGSLSSGSRALQNAQIANQIRKQEGYYPLIQAMMY